MEQVSVEARPLAQLEIQTGGAAWFRERRVQALAAFQAQGLPDPRTNEAWRYTDVRPLARRPFLTAADRTLPCVAPSELSDLRLPADRHPHLVFVNGRLQTQLSRLDDLPRGVRLRELGQVMEREPELVQEVLGALATEPDHPFTALNTARFLEGALLEVAPSARVEVPLHLVHATNGVGSSVGVLTHPRTLVLAGADSRTTLVEHFIGTRDSPYLTAPVAEVHLAENAHLDHFTLQRDSPAAHHLSRLAVRQAGDSRYTHLQLSLGGGRVRSEIEVELAGGGARTRLLGLTLAEGDQHVDHHTCIDHAVPDTTSHELYKDILDGGSAGVFTGRVKVRPRAQRTDAYQSNHNLLLSQAARVHSRPQLEIFADDVKCSHGATIGQLEPDSLFYLRSRGIDESCAGCLLTYAFASQVLEQLPVSRERTQMQQLVLERLPQVCHLVEAL